MKRQALIINALLVCAIIVLTGLALYVGARGPAPVPHLALGDEAGEGQRSATQPATAGEETPPLPSAETHFIPGATPPGPQSETPFTAAPPLPPAPGPMRDLYTNLERRDVFETIIPLPPPVVTPAPTAPPPPPLLEIVNAELKLSGVKQDKAWFTTKGDQTIEMKVNGPPYTVGYGSLTFNLTLVATDKRNQEVTIRSDKHSAPVTIRPQF